MGKKNVDKSISYQNINRDYLLDCNLSMFEYTGLPDSVNPLFLERYLQTDGCAVWCKFNGDLITIEGGTAGDLDVYGIGRDVVATTRNGHSFNLKRGVDCVVGYNNLTKTPCGDIFADADTLSDIRTSLDFLIFWTRLSPLVRVSDEKTRVIIENAFKNMRKGIPVTIASKKMLQEFGINEDISVENLTQPDFADKIQYTSKLYDDVLRWHFTKYGHSIHGDGKTAQETRDEVNSTTSQSMILPLAMLTARRTMIEEVNALFDTDIDVNFSGAWRAEVTAYEEETGEDNIDDSPDDQDSALSDLDIEIPASEDTK